VLPETEADGAVEILLHLLGRMESLRIPHAASPCAGHVTFSAGAVSLVPPPAAQVHDTLQRVDRLLYSAKAGGRRRVIHEDVASGQRTCVVPPEEAP
jgi:PleD family two-component response regulator